MNHFPEIPLYFAGMNSQIDLSSETSEETPVHHEARIIPLKPPQSRCATGKLSTPLALAAITEWHTLSDIDRLLDEHFK